MYVYYYSIIKQQQHNFTFSYITFAQRFIQPTNKIQATDTTTTMRVISKEREKKKF